MGRIPGSRARTPHPATVVQKREAHPALGQTERLPPHPATLQPKRSGWERLHDGGECCRAAPTVQRATATASGFGFGGGGKGGDDRKDRKDRDDEKRGRSFEKSKDAPKRRAASPKSKIVLGRGISIALPVRGPHMLEHFAADLQIDERIADELLLAFLRDVCRGWSSGALIALRDLHVALVVTTHAVYVSYTKPDAIAVIDVAIARLQYCSARAAVRYAASEVYPQSLARQMPKGFALCAAPQVFLEAHRRTECILSFSEIHLQMAPVNQGVCVFLNHADPCEVRCTTTLPLMLQHNSNHWCAAPQREDRLLRFENLPRSSVFSGEDLDMLVGIPGAVRRAQFFDVGRGQSAIVEVSNSELAAALVETMNGEIPDYPGFTAPISVRFV